MIYLDNAATTYPKPLCVLESVKNSPLKFGANPGRGGYEMSMRTSEEIYKTREILAKMFNAPGAENVIFTPNCTAALNIALKGLAKRGGTAVTSCLEHNSVIRPLWSLKRKGIQDFRMADVDISDEKTVRNFEYMTGHDTSYIVCAYSSNVFGDILPVKLIGEMAKKRGIPLIVDGAQAAGISDIDMKRDGISVLCLPGHKGLFGIAGTGVMILGEGVRPDTIFEGGTGSRSMEIIQPEDLPERYESGTLNTTGILSMKNGAEYVNYIGTARIRQHESELIYFLYNSLADDKRFILYNNYSERKYMPILSFNIKGRHSEETAELLGKDNIAVRGGYHCNMSAHRFYHTEKTGTVRVSVSFFNTKNHINFLLNSLNKIAKTD